MKFLKLILLLPVFLFSFELEFNKKFSQALPHDILRTHLIITITDDSEKEVDSRLNKFNELIKEYDKVEKKLGIFNIRPKFRHAGSTPIVIGYIGKLVYKVESNKALYMDEFISQITELKKFRDTTVSISNLSWTVRESTYNVTLDLLRLNAINWAQRYIGNLSNDLKKTCNLKNISIEKNLSGLALANRSFNEDINSTTSGLTVPQANPEIIEINPKFVMECK